MYADIQNCDLFRDIENIDNVLTFYSKKKLSCEIQKNKTMYFKFNISQISQHENEQFIDFDNNLNITETTFNSGHNYSKFKFILKIHPVFMFNEKIRNLLNIQVYVYNSHNHVSNLLNDQTHFVKNFCDDDDDLKYKINEKLIDFYYEKENIANGINKVILTIPFLSIDSGTIVIKLNLKKNYKSFSSKKLYGMNTLFDLLPTEILKLIVSYLDWEPLISCTMMSMVKTAYHISRIQTLCTRPYVPLNVRMCHQSFRENKNFFTHKTSRDPSINIQKIQGFFFYCKMKIKNIIIIFDEKPVFKYDSVVDKYYPNKFFENNGDRYLVRIKNKDRVKDGVLYYTDKRYNKITIQIITKPETQNIEAYIITGL